MKFNCGETPRERAKRRRLEKETYYLSFNKWRKKFAFLPVRVSSRDCRWLEYVEVKNSYYYSHYRYTWLDGGREYRAIE